MHKTGWPRFLFVGLAVLATALADPPSVSDSEIDRAVAVVMAKRFDGDREKFLTFLRKQGKTVREYRAEIAERLRKGQPIDREDEVRLRIIQLNRRAGETDAVLVARAKDTVLAKLSSGETFADVAKHYSDDKKRSEGGDWGWLKRSELKKVFSDAAFELNKGEMSPPIIVPEGCFVLLVEDRR